MRTRFAALVGSAFLFVACAHTKNATRCPESADIQCLSALDCASDETRQCMVCRCSPLGGQPSSSHTPLYAPPEPLTNE